MITLKKFSSAILFQKGVYFIIKEEIFRKGFFQPHLFCNSRASLNDWRFLLYLNNKTWIA